MSAGFDGTAAAIESAVLKLKVTRIVVCGHRHCGGIRALYEGVSPQATNLEAWLELGREAVLPVRLSPEALRRTEQRAVALQLERLMGYPMVRERVEAGEMTLHGWHDMIEDGEVHAFDVRSVGFVARRWWSTVRQGLACFTATQTRIDGLALPSSTPAPAAPQSPAPAPTLGRR